jgi:arylsulfatase A
MADGLTEGKSLEHPAMFWQWNRGVPEYSHNAAMREGPWKLVRPYVNRKFNPEPSTEKPVLYNLELDLSEQRDLAEEKPEIYLRMKKELEIWSRDVERDRRNETPSVMEEKAD